MMTMIAMMMITMVEMAQEFSLRSDASITDNNPAIHRARLPYELTRCWRKATWRGYAVWKRVLKAVDELSRVEDAKQIDGRCV